MSEYTPTTEEVKQRYKAGAWLKGDRNPDQFNPAVYEPLYFAEFDRWLNSVKAEAWDEGHGAPCDRWIRSEMCREYHPNPYRTGGAE